MNVVDLYKEVEGRISIKGANIHAAQVDFEQATKELEEAEQEKVEIEKALDLLKVAADSQREQVKMRIESVVRLALRSVFGDSVDFCFEQEVKRGTVYMTPKVGQYHSGEWYWVHPKSVGGGMGDVLSFSMRVALLAALRGKVPQVIVADEPFKHVSAQYLPKVARMIRTLADKTNVQMVIVSHEPEIAEAASRHVELCRDGGSTAIMNKGDQ